MAKSHAALSQAEAVYELEENERKAWIAAAASPVAPNWKWMTHPSRNNGNPIPVFVFVEQGVTYYRPFDTEATEFEWELRDDEWAEFAAPEPQADARDNLLAALENLLASITGGQKQCGHDFDCVCPEDQARAAIAKATGRADSGDGAQGGE